MRTFYGTRSACKQDGELETEGRLISRTIGKLNQALMQVQNQMEYNRTGIKVADNVQKRREK